MARLLDEIDNLLLAVDTELRIDISHMHFHRITRNHKLLFHEGEIAALGQLLEHFGLSRRKTELIGKAAARAFPVFVSVSPISCGICGRSRGSISSSPGTPSDARAPNTPDTPSDVRRSTRGRKPFFANRKASAWVGRSISIKNEEEDNVDENNDKRGSLGSFGMRSHDR